MRTNQKVRFQLSYSPILKLTEQIVLVNLARSRKRLTIANANKYCSARYAHLCTMAADDALPGSEPKERLLEIAALARQHGTMDFLHRRHKAWIRTVTAAIKKTREDLAKKEGMRDDLDRKTDREAFDQSILKDARRRSKRANEIDDGLKVLMKDVKEALE
jgi:hypothetical protein